MNMVSDILVESMIGIQQSYLSLLKKYDVIDYNSLCILRREITIFWNRHKRQVSFFLENYPSDFDTAVFIGGAYLNIESNAHFPFLMIGKKHIMDDPIFLLTLPKVDSPSILQYVKSAVEDNIRILMSLENRIIILPLSQLFVDRGICSEFANKSFLQMFDGDDITLENYFRNFKNVEEVFSSINENIANDFLLEYDGKSVYERYCQHLKKIEVPFEDGTAAVKQFYQICMGLYMQVAVVYDFCTHYQMFPFIRNRTLFFSLYSVLQMILRRNDNVFFKNLLKLSSIAHSMNCLLDWEMWNVSFDDFKSIALNSDFETSVMNGLEGENINFSKIKDILCSEMKDRNIPCLSN